jgi:hypothetical protein
VQKTLRAANSLGDLSDKKSPDEELSKRRNLRAKTLQTKTYPGEELSDEEFFG